VANKKTFLLIHALEAATPKQKQELESLMKENRPDKVEKVLAIFHDCKIDEWALQLKNKYLDEALDHLEDIAVLSKRKQPLKEMAQFLIKRES
jgi:geranylgeranyl diphosphate synthase type II